MNDPAAGPAMPPTDAATDARTGAFRPPPHRRGRVPLWWADATGILTWLSLLVVTALWVASGGLQVTDPAGALTSLGRLTGLFASDLLLIQVLLMARIPFVERSYGQDRLTRIHANVGIGSFVLMTAHIGLILLGYAGGSLARLWPVTVDVVLEMPAMLLATAGVLALTLVVLTSAVRRVRASLRYESWHLLHLYAYVGVFLALPHQLWTGADFLAHPWATAYWWTLWALAAVAVLVFRVGLPIVRSRRHDLRVATVVPAGPGMTRVVFTGRELDRLPVQAGQFFIWRFLDGPGWTRGNPYSLSAAPDGRGLEITVASVGDGSARVARLEPGTRVLIEGPYGRLHPGVRRGRRVTLLACGMGIAPMKSLLEALDVEPGEVTVIHRAHDAATAALLDQLARVADERGARFLVLAGPRQDGRASWLPQSWEQVDDAAALAHLVPDLRDNDVYVCGDPAWVDLVLDALGRAGVPDEQVHAERCAYSPRTIPDTAQEGTT